MLYQQHSHDKTRNVSFKAGYHPLSPHSSVRQLELTPLRIEDEVKGQDDIITSALSALHTLPDIVSYSQIIAGVPVAFGGRTGLSGPSKTVIKDGFLQYEQPYQAVFSSDMDAYTLTAKDFAGNIIVVTESKQDGRIEVKETKLSTLKRIVVTPKRPFGS